MQFENIILEKKDEIGIIKINIPSALNALNSKTLMELEKGLIELEMDDKVKVLIITGEGEKAFCAGADLKELKEKNALQAKEYLQLGHRVLNRIENLKKPVIAAINGYALGGGCELALACDLRIASPRAKIGLPEINLGIFPGFGGTQRLPRLIGISKAKELIFTGNIIDSKTAESIGLINKVVFDSDLMEEAIALAKNISSKSTIAIKAVKSLINKSLDVDLKTGRDLEIETLAVCFTTEDHLEGINAFLEKRKPVFMGR
ncbi:MAG: enoyl-CoA hydratase-related protein [Methanosarcinales archaeon]